MSNTKLMEDLAARMESAVRAKDTRFLDRLAMFAGVHGLDTWFTLELGELVKVMPHDVQEFWLGECNCDRHQN